MKRVPRDGKEARVCEYRSSLTNDVMPRGEAANSSFIVRCTSVYSERDYYTAPIGLLIPGD